MNENTMEEKPKNFVNLIIITVVAFGISFLFVFFMLRDPSATTSPSSLDLQNPRNPRNNLTEEDIIIIKDCLRYLRELDSITSAGINYSEYSSRVLDAKVKFDYRIHDLSQNCYIWKTKLSDVMYDYNNTRNIWMRQIRQGGGNEDNQIGKIWGDASNQIDQIEEQLKLQEKSQENP